MVKTDIRLVRQALCGPRDDAKHFFFFYLSALLKSVLPSQVPVKPGPVESVMWSRMKALCQSCLVSKHSAGSSTHTSPRLLMLVLGLHRCVCFMHAWPADIHLCELPSRSRTGRSTGAPLPDPPPYRRSITACFIPFQLVLYLRHSLSVLLYHPGQFRDISQSSLASWFSSHVVYR